MIVSKVKIRLDNSDGTYQEVTNNMPFEIAEKIVGVILTWEDDWYATMKTVKNYQESEKMFKQ